MNFKYQEILVETYENQGEPSSSRLRARPLPNQGLPTNVNVECSKKMRASQPVGTVFRIRAKVTDREGTLFVYSRFSWRYEVVPEDHKEVKALRRA